MIFCIFEDKRVFIKIYSYIQLLCGQIRVTVEIGVEAMQPFRQGDVILVPVRQFTGNKLSHLTLAKGEVTGHSHRVINGQAELYEQNGVLYLVVLSNTATVSHEEHRPLSIPQGAWMVRIQREYVPQRRHTPAQIPTSEKHESDLWGSLINQAPRQQKLPSLLAESHSNSDYWSNLIPEIEPLTADESSANFWDTSEQLLGESSNFKIRPVIPNYRYSAD